jgi:hypothetical protein
LYQERAELEALRKKDGAARGGARPAEEELKQRTYEVRKLLRDNQDPDTADQELHK